MIANTIDNLSKGIFKRVESNITGIENHHSKLALLFITIVFTYQILILYFLKDTPLYTSLMLKESRELNRFIFGAVGTLPLLLLLIIFMISTKQKFSSVGIRSEGLKSSLICGGFLLLILIIKKGFNFTFPLKVFYNLIFSFIFIGLFEELLYRGFLLPRLEVLFGNKLGIFLTGILFSLAHIPIQVVWLDINIIDALLKGSDTQVNFIQGLIFHYIISYLYTRNNNILLPVLIHGFGNILGSN